MERLFRSTNCYLTYFLNPTALNTSMYLQMRFLWIPMSRADRQPRRLWAMTLGSTSRRSSSIDAS